MNTAGQGGMKMMERRNLYLIAALVFLIFTAIKPVLYAESKGAPEKSSGAVVEVNSVKFTNKQFDAEMTKKLASLKAQVPPDKLQQIKPEVRKQIIDDFVIRTLLSQEVKRLKISVTDQEVTEAIDRVKSTLPPRITFDELLKKNDLTNEKFREEITLGVKI
ncbi:MAG: SurA N-terminal domain-containing protein, partial [Syntrophales bacterium]|nr:SurA N-terminal domain-containing protein [Syntrophales bacterium]